MPNINAKNDKNKGNGKSVITISREKSDKEKDLDWKAVMENRLADLESRIAQLEKNKK